MPRSRPATLRVWGLWLSLLVFFTVSFFGYTGTAHPPLARQHRCLHARSSLLQNTALNAAKLDILPSVFDAGDSKQTNRTATPPVLVSDERQQQNTAAPSAPAAGVPSANLSPLSATTAARAVLSSPPSSAAPQHAAAYPPFRIHFDVSHLYNGTHFCSQAGQLRADKLGSSVYCNAEDVLEPWKRDFLLHRLLPWLGVSVQQWLRLPRSARTAADAARRPSSPAKEDDRSSRVVVPQGICGAQVHVPPAHSTRGVDNTDFIVYVLAAPLHDAITTANARASASASSHTVAWATYCAVDSKTERPLVAMMNLVPSSLTISDAGVAALTTKTSATGPLSLLSGLLLDAVRAAFSSPSAKNAKEQRQLRDIVYHANYVMDAYYAAWTSQHYRSVLHELLHALGFAPPQLRRHAAQVRFDRSDWEGEAEANRATTTKTATPPQRTITVVTAPAVRSAVQRWMNCSDAVALPGAALEQSGPEGTAGAHWERVLFHGDLMAGVLSPTAALSDMTLAFFDSLPFYRVDRSFAELPVWGEGAGCGFAEGQCRPLQRAAAFDQSAVAPVNSAKAATDLLTRARYWCEPSPPSAVGHAQCTADRRAIGFCYGEMVSRPSSPRGGVVGAKQARSRSTTTSSKGHGLSLLMEGCPIVEPYIDRLCDTPSALDAYSDATRAEAQFRVRVLTDGQAFYFGPYSRCFASSEVRRIDPATTFASRQTAASAVNAAQDDVAYAVSPGNSSTNSALSASPSSSLSPRTLVTARCLQTRCTKGGVAVEVRVGLTWVACPANGQAGIVPIPPASGYTGHIGCETAAMYCADAAQLQRPAVSTASSDGTRMATDSDAGPLPFNRVTVTFFLKWDAEEETNPLLLRAGDLSSSSSTPQHESQYGVAAAAAFRTALLGSDRAFQAALQQDLARHRALSGLSPLGAVRAQQRAGAVRLVGASLAAFAQDAETALSEAAFPAHWTALVSADVEVVARDAEEASAHIQSWLSAGVSSPSAAFQSRPAELGESAAHISALTFSAVAEWLSRVSCSAALTIQRRRDTDTGIPPVGLLYSTSPVVLSSVFAAVAKDGATSRLRSVCPPSTRTLPPPRSWAVAASPVATTIAEVGPLDVSEQLRESADQLEVAMVHLHLRRPVTVCDDTATASLSSSSASPPAGWVTGGKVDLLTSMSHTEVLLALRQDVAAVLGVSPRWVRLASMRRTPLSMPSRESREGENAGDVQQRHGGGATSARDAVEVLLVVSLPAFDEAPAPRQPFNNRNNSNVSEVSVSQTWSAFASDARRRWRLQLHGIAASSAASALAWQPLSRVNTALATQLLSTDAASRRRFASCASLRLVSVDARSTVHRPRPGVSDAEFFDSVEDASREPWWSRRVLTIKGVSVTVAAVLCSVLIATLLLLCTWRCGC